MGENAMDEPLDVIGLRFFIETLEEETFGGPGWGRRLVGAKS
jgi:hypothetical protein